MSKRKKRYYDDWEFDYYRYQPPFPGGLPGVLGNILGVPGYQGTPGYQPGAPGYQPGGPGYQPGAPGYPPGGPGYYPGGPGAPGGPGYGSQAAPTSPPPTFVPQKPYKAGGPGTYAVSPGSLQRCLFHFTYIWLRNGNQFWFYPIYLDRTTVAGYRWNGRRWNYFGVDLNRIDEFQCY